MELVSQEVRELNKAVIKSFVRDQDQDPDNRFVAVVESGAGARKLVLVPKEVTANGGSYPDENIQLDENVGLSYVRRSGRRLVVTSVLYPHQTCDKFFKGLHIAVSESLRQVGML